MRPAGHNDREASDGFSPPRTTGSVRAQFVASLSLVIIVALALVGTSLLLPGAGSLPGIFKYSTGEAKLMDGKGSAICG